VVNAAERGPLATVGGPLPTFRKRFGIESVSGCGFLYRLLKPEITVKQQSKTSKKRKNNLLKTKKVLNTEIEQNGDSVFAFSLSEGRFAPLYVRQSRHCCKPVLCSFTVQE